jgi:competence protein ComEA
MRRRFLPLIFLSWLLVAAQAACVRLPRRAVSATGQNAPPVARVEPPGEALVNLNTATRSELEKLPGIGEALAARIVEHRERYGRFRRAEHLLMVRGISERRFRAINAVLMVE